MRQPFDDLGSGALVGLAIHPSLGAAWASVDGSTGFVATDDVCEVLDRFVERVAPRWVWWSKETAARLLDLGIRPSKCWDLSAVHRLVHGGWRCEPAHVWAAVNGLDPARLPDRPTIDLFHQEHDDGDPDEPVRPDGHLRHDWAEGAWSDAPARMVAWAELAVECQRRQDAALGSEPTEHVGPFAGADRRRRTAMSESAAEILCAELERDGLPMDRAAAERIVAGFVGTRPLTVEDEVRRLAERDAEVLAHLPVADGIDLRSPDSVRSLLRRAGIEVPDTRAWRLERMVDRHPVVAPLLAWRRAERIRTTFGYLWIDEHLGADGRLRGHWSGSDGAAGRMTATAGLHNMPGELRPAIVAEEGHVFVRADLGQIEPRVLAAISGDDALAHATHDDDMYQRVAGQLGTDRALAKLAVLGAMYGATTGRGAEALARLEREYPVAMGYLRDADTAAQGGTDLRTFGGRRVAMSAGDGEHADRDGRNRAAARGRFGRNAMVQGAAAEFFKTWAVLVRARGTELGATIVLCLHDELVVHVAAERSHDVVELIDRCLAETAHRWAPPSDVSVRFVTDTSVVGRWSEAK